MGAKSVPAEGGEGDPLNCTALKSANDLGLNIHAGEG